MLNAKIRVLSEHLGRVRRGEGGGAGRCDGVRCPFHDWSMF